MLLLLLFFVYSTFTCPVCEEGSVCYPGIGCITVEQTIIRCDTHCIDTQLTPTLKCHTLIPCPASSHCREIRDSDHCRSLPLFSTDGSCVQQGAPRLCPDHQECIPGAGCPPNNDDTTALTAFLLILGALTIFALLIIGIVAT